MSIKIIKGERGEEVLYNSVTMVAFGLVHEDSDFELEDFLEWLKPEKAGNISAERLDAKYYEWLQESRDLKEAEDRADEEDFKRDVASLTSYLNMENLK